MLSLAACLCGSCWRTLCVRSLVYSWPLSKEMKVLISKVVHTHR